MNILIIAPESDLSSVAEIVSAISGNQSTVLTGTVTQREVLGHIKSGQFEAIHIATHGNYHSLQMSDGTLSADLIEEAIHASGTINLVVLNSCKSIQAAAEIYARGVAYTVGWTYEVPDEVAGTFGRLFWSSLGLNSSIQIAYQTAADHIEKQHPPLEPPILLNGRIVGLRDEIARLRQLMDDPSWLDRMHNYLNAFVFCVVALIAIQVLDLVLHLAFIP